MSRPALKQNTLLKKIRRPLRRATPADFFESPGPHKSRLRCRFALRSGHARRAWSCPLRAKNGSARAPSLRPALNRQRGDVRQTLTNTRPRQGSLGHSYSPEQAVPLTASRRNWPIRSKPFRLLQVANPSFQGLFSQGLFSSLPMQRASMRTGI